MSDRRGHKEHVTTELYPVPFGAFDDCFVQLLGRCQNVCCSKGDYFEGGDDDFLIPFVSLLAA